MAWGGDDRRTRPPNRRVRAVEHGVAEEAIRVFEHRAPGPCGWFRRRSARSLEFAFHPHAGEGSNSAVMALRGRLWEALGNGELHPHGGQVGDLKGAPDSARRSHRLRSVTVPAKGARTKPRRARPARSLGRRGPRSSMRWRAMASSPRPPPWAQAISRSWRGAMAGSTSFCARATTSRYRATLRLRVYAAFRGSSGALISASNCPALTRHPRRHERL